MKKNRMMRLASILLVCVLLTTSVISGTFAKYTTSATVEDSARVAYWGFGKADAIIFDLFSTSYNSNAISSADNVLAPGASQSTTFAFKYTGNTGDAIKAPEVKYSVNVDATITNSNKHATYNLDENPNFVWTLKAANADTASEYATLDELEAAIEKLDGSEAGAATYAAGKLPAALVGGETEAAASDKQVVSIGWNWKFENDADATPDGTKDENEFDTAMGNMDPLEAVTIVITITAEQLS